MHEFIGYVYFGNRQLTNFHAGLSAVLAGFEKAASSYRAVVVTTPPMASDLGLL